MSIRTFWLTKETLGVKLLLIAASLVAASGRDFAAAPAADPSAEDARMRDRVNVLLAETWKSLSVKPAERATDEEFLRRAYLDLTGRIPRVSETRAFFEDSAADKRQRLIDDLLLRPSHPSHLADEWCRFLLPDTAAVNQVGGSDAFETWLRNRFAENRSYGDIVRELLLATGQPNESGPVLFYTSLELKPEKVAASTSRAFLGIQIQCAECHNHPFDKWTQKDFWGYAAFFARISQQADQTMRVSLVSDQDKGEVKLPDSSETVPPRYLLGDVAAEQKSQTRRMQLAEWMTSPQNPYFARAAVNRVWAQLFGRGLVDPPDDMSEANKPRLSALLDELAKYFASTNYDVRRLFRVLATTDAYQLASVHASEGERPPDVFAAMQLKVLTAEQLYNCVAVATCRPYDDILATVPSSMAKRAMTNRDSFVNKFGAPSGRPTEYRVGIPQALMLLNGRLVDDATDLQRSDVLVALEAPFFSDEDRIDTLFLATLSRLPSAEIRDKFRHYLAAESTPEAKQKALGNVLWALLNSAEFAMNH
ncbi:MAG: DUF1549 and DUF1553 domain-containing protein [Planctomycetaceae bacterium]